MQGRLCARVRAPPLKGTRRAGELQPLVRSPLFAARRPHRTCPTPRSTTCTPDNPGNCTICASTASDEWYGGPNAAGQCVP